MPKKLRPIIQKIKDQKQKKSLLKLLDSFSQDPPTVEERRTKMDSIWDELGCDNTNPDPKCLEKYYLHPIWTLNGLLIDIDPHSLENRLKIAEYIARKVKKGWVLDFGGGFGNLARLIAKQKKSLKVAIFEPFPSELAMDVNKRYKQVYFVEDCEHSKYECLVATDVLEHIPDPLLTLEMMKNTVKDNGLLIIGNCFHPIIKCHLISNFHFRYSFPFIAYLFGLKRIGRCPGVEYSVIYKKTPNTKTNWLLVRIIEKISIFLFPILEMCYLIYKESGLLSLRLALMKYLNQNDKA